VWSLGRLGSACFRELRRARIHQIRAFINLWETHLASSQLGSVSLKQSRTWETGLEALVEFASHCALPWIEYSRSALRRWL
jgi:hypothetical protein